MRAPRTFRAIAFRRRFHIVKLDGMIRFLVLDHSRVASGRWKQSLGENEH
jgi:hypothetical protein